MLDLTGALLRVRLNELFGQQRHLNVTAQVGLSPASKASACLAAGGARTRVIEGEIVNHSIRGPGTERSLVAGILVLYLAPRFETGLGKKHIRFSVNDVVPYAERVIDRAISS